ncbi:hypothetical protein Btru_017599 [Bulinus truncatus]|nr:hypothetical protein Btru_017599 [Bulinus truncatus]
MNSNDRKKKSFFRQTCISVFLGGLLVISFSANFLNMYKNDKTPTCRSYANELGELGVKKEEVRALKGVVSFLSEPAINAHNFSYLSNPTATCFSPPEVLVVVPSAPSYFWRRKRARQFFAASFAGSSNRLAKMLFFLGKPYQDDTVDAKVQGGVEDEVLKHNDIVQEDFEDNFHNYRLKAVSMLKWPSSHCKGAKYVVRMDDDVEFNASKVLEAMKKTSGVFANFVLGHRKENGAPVRSRSDRMFMSKEEYPERTFPVYVCGRLQAYPMSTVRLLYQATLRVPSIWIEDVFITGMCARQVDIALVNLTGDDYKHVQN